MKIAEGLVEARKVPFTLWLLCLLRRDDRFGEFILDPVALQEYVEREEKRLTALKEESNTLTPEQIIYGRMMAPTWRKEHRLVGNSMPELVVALSIVMAADNLIWHIVYQDERGVTARVLLTRCYFTFS